MFWLMLGVALVPAPTPVLPTKQWSDCMANYALAHYQGTDPADAIANAAVSACAVHRGEVYDLYFIVNRRLYSYTEAPFVTGEETDRLQERLRSELVARVEKMRSLTPQK